MIMHYLKIPKKNENFSNVMTFLDPKPFETADLHCALAIFYFSSGSFDVVFFNIIHS